MSNTASLRTGLKLGSAAIALAAFAAPAFAQDEQPAPPAPTGASAEEQAAATGDQGEVITVTARRRAESLIDVPIAISAYSGEQLENEGAIDLTDIADTTPNVTIEASRGTNSTLTAFIRGVGQQDPVAGFEAGVGLYLDDVYLNRPQAALLDIYDVERIEVLRGPQGTLYGRNTIGGAIKYVTRRMPADPQLGIRGTLGTYQQADLVLTASTPVTADHRLRVGGAIARLSRGGFGDNLTTGLENYNKDVWAGRLGIEYNNDHNVFVRLQGDYTADDSNPRGGHRLIPGIATGAPVLTDVFDSRGALLDPRQRVRSWGMSLYAEAQPWDHWTLRSITAYRRDHSGTPIDFDALPSVNVDVPAVYRNHQTSQEVQLLYDNRGLHALVGAYFLDANGVTIFDVRLPGGVTALTFGDVNTETYAVFGDFTYDFSPMFSVSLGGRYTWDQRSSHVLRQTYLGGGSPFFGGGGTLFATTSNFTGTADFEKFTPRASVSFHPAENQTLYASYSQGFKGGGFDPRGVTTACRTPTGVPCNAQQIYDFMSFDPETVTSYELGYRAALFDRRLNVSVNLFRANYRDVQVPGSIGTVINGQQTFIGITTNAGRARFQGLETEGNAIIARSFGTEGDSLNFAWSLGYLDAKYLRFIDSRGIDVASEREIQNTPRWTASGTLGYEAPVASGRLNINSTLSYRSSSQQFELRTPMLDQPGFVLWDANLVWRSNNDRWSIGLHGRNLTNKRYIVSGYNFLSQNPDTGDFNRNPVTGNYIPTLGNEGVLTAFYGNPRQVFVSVGFNFR
jgi:iron complex outermembrane receptor protein